MRRLKPTISDWFMAYTNNHPEVDWSPPTTLMLDDRNEVQPDVMLFTAPAQIGDDGYLSKLSELVVEIAHSSHARDLHQKKTAYERNDVAEYIVWDTRDNVLHWFRLADGKYREVEPSGGRIESTQFPGLVLDVRALLARDRTRLLAALA
jgi:Uma2 family endonuclease